MEAGLNSFCMPKVYIVGATGFLGGAFAAYLQEQGVPVVTDRVDVTDGGAVRAAFERERPDVVVNFAGVRAEPNIDWCETHKPETVAVNVGGALTVMLAALEVGAYPIQIASGCIYHGGPEHAFSEEDAPNFTGSFYSRMRIVMQDALRELPVLQARIRMPISRRSHPRNLINKLINYPKIISLPNSATLIEDLWPVLVKLFELRPTGILNLTNDGYTDNAAVLEAYRAVVKPDHQYAVISEAELYQTLTKAERSNCVLATDKLHSLGLALPALDAARWREIMTDYKQSL